MQIFLGPKVIKNYVKQGITIKCKEKEREKSEWKETELGKFQG